MNILKYLKQGLILLLLFAFLFSGSAFATEVVPPQPAQEPLPAAEEGSQPEPAAEAEDKSTDDFVDHFLAKSGNSVTMDEKVNGSVFLSGRIVRLNGIVKGDAFCAGETVIVNGDVKGNLFVGANTVRINGKVSGDVFCGTNKLTIEEGATLKRDLFFGANTLQQNGQIGRDINGGGQKITLNGPLDGSAKVSGDAIALQSNAHVKGDLDYNSAKKAKIDSAAQIDGDTHHQKITGQMTSDEINWGDFLLGLLWSFLALFLIFLAWRLWGKESLQGLTRPFFARPLRAMLWGFIMLVVFLPLAILLCVTIIGAPLGLILIAFGLVVLYLSRLMVVLFVTGALGAAMKKPHLASGVLLNGILLFLLTLVAKFPGVGAIVTPVLMVLGSWLTFSFIAARILRPKHSEPDNDPSPTYQSRYVAAETSSLPEATDKMDLTQDIIQEQAQTTQSIDASSTQEEK